MQTILKAHCKTQESKDAFDHVWTNSKSLRDRLQKILADKIAEAEKRRVDPLQYDSPNWQLIQADCNSAIRTLTEVTKLLND